jgi:hypothetical protein
MTIDLPTASRDNRDYPHGSRFAFLGGFLPPNHHLAATAFLPD